MHSDQPCFPKLGYKDERKLLAFLIGKTNQDKSNENSRGYLVQAWRELGVATCVLGEGSKEDCGKSEKVPSWPFVVYSEPWTKPKKGVIRDSDPYHWDNVT